MTRRKGSWPKACAEEKALAADLAKIARVGGPNLFDYVVSELERFAGAGTFCHPEQEKNVKAKLYRFEYGALRERGFTNARALQKVSKTHNVSKKTIERATSEARAAWVRYKASHPPVSFEVWTAVQGKFNDAASITAAKKKDKT